MELEDDYLTAWISVINMKHSNCVVYIPRPKSLNRILGNKEEVKNYSWRGFKEVIISSNPEFTSVSMSSQVWIRSIFIILKTIFSIVISIQR